MFREKLLKAAIKLYLGEHVLERVFAQGFCALQVGAVQSEMTVMWIEPKVNWTQLATLNPGEIAGARIEYWSTIIQTIEQNCGVVDNYVGDAIMAYFGGKDGENHAALAISCAACVLESLRKSKAPFAAVFSARIGIDTGPVSFGNIGTAKRLKFTVMGDVVNVAARLIGRMSDFRARVLLTGAVKSSAGTAANEAVLRVGELNIAQKAETIELFSFHGALEA